MTTRTLSELTWFEIKQTMAEIIEKHKNKFGSVESTICFYFGEKYGWNGKYVNKDLVSDYIDLPKIYRALFKDEMVKYIPNV